MKLEVVRNCLQARDLGLFLAVSLSLLMAPHFFVWRTWDQLQPWTDNYKKAIYSRYLGEPELVVQKQPMFLDGLTFRYRISGNRLTKQVLYNMLDFK